MKRRHFLKGAAATTAALALPLLPKLARGNTNRNPCTEIGPPTPATPAKPVNCECDQHPANNGGCSLRSTAQEEHCGGDCFLMTQEKITDACDTWLNFPGFSGETCGKCKRKVNTLGRGPGWFCCCGHYNNQDHSGNRMPHETPDLGPTWQTIRLGLHRSKVAAKERQWWRD